MPTFLPDGSEFALAQPDDVLAVDPDLARVRLHQADQMFEQHALAAAAASDDHQRLTALPRSDRLRAKFPATPICFVRPRTAIIGGRRFVAVEVGASGASITGALSSHNDQRATCDRLLVSRRENDVQHHGEEEIENQDGERCIRPPLRWSPGQPRRRLRASLGPCGN